MDAQVFAIKAMMLGMWYDAYTHTFRYLCPSRTAYSYGGSLCADTLELLPKGEVRQREKERRCRNTVSGKRLGGVEWLTKR